MSLTARSSPAGTRMHPGATVHPTAIVEGDVEIGSGTAIGPGCMVLGTLGPVRIGAGCTLVARAIVNGPIVLGDGNVLYPGACLGFAPQDPGFDPSAPGPGCVIGHRNVFREGATVNRGATDRPTRVGDSNYWMTNTHLGHDALVGSNCIFASGCVLAGHVEVQDRVIIGGCTSIQRSVRLGRGSFVSGTICLGLDLPPWFTATADNLVASINLVGLRRSGAGREAIDAVRWAFRTIYRSGATPQQAIPLLEERISEPAIAECVAFMRATTRGICHGVGRAGRGAAAAAADE
ncbi:MAG: UDP-N-acetylglucosamine O-acyltransferase [Phycisphaerales bacterium]